MQLGLTLLVALVATAYAQHRPGFEDPGQGREEAALPSMAPPGSGRLEAVDEVIERIRGDLLGRPGVIGVARGRTEDGADAVVVWVSQPADGEQIPREIEGYPVVVHIVPGGFHALPT